MRSPRLALLVMLALLGAGCGEILKEIDNANDLAGKPTGNRPGAAPGKAPAAARSGTPAPAGAPKPEETKEAPGIVAQVQAWLGLDGEAKDRRRPPDPNDPMVVCRLGGSTSFMLKSGCLNRSGSVVASKGVPH
jgi:hypothetical protein